jgi:hypothetical protein
MVGFGRCGQLLIEFVWSEDVFGDVVALEQAIGFIAREAEGAGELEVGEAVLAVEFDEHGFFAGAVDVSEGSAEIGFYVEGEFDGNGHENPYRIIYLL